MHERLADAGEAGWERFTAMFTPPVPFEVPGQVPNPHRFTAKLSYQGKPFASAPIEVSSVEAGNATHYDTLSSNALTLVGLPTTDAVAVMIVPWQVAQKLHACTDIPEPPQTNDRAHDLVDLQLLESLLADDNLTDTREACIAVFDARARHSWPPVVRAQPRWEPIYRQALEGLNHLELAPNVVAATERVGAFVDRINRSSQ